MTIYGDGSQTRSFCYVSDLVEGLMRLMNGDFIGPVNLGNPGEYTILELAQIIQGMINPDTELIYKPSPEIHYPDALQFPVLRLPHNGYRSLPSVKEAFPLQQTKFHRA